jgi:hypothetical protein
MLAHWARLSRRQYEYSIFFKLIFFLLCFTGTKVRSRYFLFYAWQHRGLRLKKENAKSVRKKVLIFFF